MMVHPNIFQHRNNWNVITLQAKRYSYKDAFATRVAAAIKSETGVDVFLDGKRRKRQLVESRQMFAAIMCAHTGKTLEQIGNMLGQDHSTIMYSEKSISNLCETNKEFKTRYDRINLQIKL